MVDDATAIVDAAYHGDLAAVLRLLFEDPGLVNARGFGQWTPLMWAADKGCVELARLLLQWGAEVDAVDRFGRSALHHACREGRVEVVDVLLEAGADQHIRNRDVMTPLMSASINGRLGVVESLLRWPGGRAEEEEVAKALLAACSGGHAEVVRALLVVGGADHGACAEYRGVEMTPWDMAEQKGHAHVLQVLQWFEDEVERSLVLLRARGVADGVEAVRQSARQDRARAEAVAPAFLRGRVARGEALPRVEVGGRGAGNKRKEGETEVVEEAVLRHVVMGMKEDPFRVLMALMRYR